MGRLDYQHQWAVGNILNIGCGDDPAKFYELGATNFDIDWWDYPKFVQGDCHVLPFADKSFDTAILGDTLEHCERPEVAVAEAARVAKRLVMTIPEETRLPSVGQHIQVGLKIRADVYRKEDGFPSEMSDEDVLVSHKKKHCKQFVTAYPEKLQSHDSHINRFDEAWIQRLIAASGMPILDSRKVPEVDWMNWLISLGV